MKLIRILFFSFIVASPIILVAVSAAKSNKAGDITEPCRGAPANDDPCNNTARKDSPTTDEKGDQPKSEAENPTPPQPAAGSTKTK